VTSLYHIGYNDVRQVHGSTVGSGEL